ncbi:hypothetical protein D5086_010144 [Populus alba]|uniref:Uncharacterized protein n=1 Tax=Populus alba TaxID=43335 RepID=A0ACC4C9M7_POPAL
MASNDLKDKGNWREYTGKVRRPPGEIIRNQCEQNSIAVFKPEKMEVEDPVLRETSYPPGLHGVTVAENVGSGRSILKKVKYERSSLFSKAINDTRVSLEAPWGVLCGGEQWLFGVDNTITRSTLTSLLLPDLSPRLGFYGTVQEIYEKI